MSNANPQDPVIALIAIPKAELFKWHSKLMASQKKVENLGHIG